MRNIIIGAGRVGLGALSSALAMQGHEVVFAALSFAEHGDSQAAELQKLVRERNVEHSLDFVSQLRPWNPISKLIRDEVRSASS